MPETPPPVDGKVAPGLIAVIAEIKSWEISPTKDSDSTLQMTFTIKNWENVPVVRGLAAGQIVLRVLPLQLGLQEPVGCLHPKEASMPFQDGRAVCLNCGCILDVPADDKPEEKAPPA